MKDIELREIKRRFTPDRCNIAKIVGCFVNENKQIIYRINQSIGLSDSDAGEKLLSTMKKSLSGSIGTALTNIEFSTRQVLESEEHKLLMRLRESRLSDSDALEAFYLKAIESLNFDGNYVILLASDLYDVFERSSDGAKGDSSEVFSYLVCSVCPLKKLPEALTFKEADSLFHPLGVSAVLAPPEVGFMFPAFDERKTNIYGALFYTKNLGESYAEFCEKIFAAEAKMPPKLQKNAFSSCISEALGEECSCDVITSVHSQLEEIVESHKESKSPEPLTITKETVKTVLEHCGVEKEKIGRLESSLDESFGAGAELTPKNIVSLNKFELTSPDVKISISPEHRSLVSTQKVGDSKYIMIKVTGPVLVNGIEISIED